MSTNHPTAPQSYASLWPGLSFVAAIALAATGVAALFANLPAPIGPVPVSAMLVAIIIGLAVGRYARAQPTLEKGLALAKGPILKTAVALVGLRLSLTDLVSTGGQALPLVVAMIATGLVLVLGLGKVFKVSPRLVILLAAGTSICGASAIAAASPALKAKHEETCYAIACIGVLGLLAILIYPVILQQALIDPDLVGLALGTVIHDTAQVTAAAVYHQQLWPNDQTLDAATVAKLMRNSTMLVVIPALVLFYYRREQGASGARSNVPFPMFIVAFVIFSVVRTLVDGWVAASDTATLATVWRGALALAHQFSLLAFAMAMSALAISVSPSEVRSLGIRGFLVALVATVTMLVVALAWLS